MKNTIWICLLFAFVIVSGHQAKEGDSLNWTPEYSIEFLLPQSPLISPDGRLIACTVREAVTKNEDSKYISHIWMASADGSFNRQYTRGDHSCDNLAFSPDRHSAI